MKKINLLILIAIFTISCSKKEVKIPVLPVKGLQELHNHSQIWFFFKEKNGDTVANINRNNAIISTHWIYNVDRRLPLKAIIPAIEKFKDKHANSMHSKENTHNYFSYSDTANKKLSFFLFDSIQFKTKQPKINSLKEIDSLYNATPIFFKKETVCIDNKNFSKKVWKEKLSEHLQKSPKKLKLFLSFDENMTFQDYLWYRSIIQTLNKIVHCDKKEYIINTNNSKNCI